MISFSHDMLHGAMVGYFSRNDCELTIYCGLLGLSKKCDFSNEFDRWSWGQYLKFIIACMTKHEDKQHYKQYYLRLLQVIDDKKFSIILDEDLKKYFLYLKNVANYYNDFENYNILLQEILGDNK